MALIQRTGFPQSARIIDVGGGASTLVDDLLERGYRNISVVDVSAATLEQVRSRLGERAADIEWIVGNITNVNLRESAYDIWHDRALFHFLIDAGQRAAYVAQMHRALKEGGQIVIATFAPEAPPKCSELPVQRYTPDQLHRALGDSLVLEEHHNEVHVTPGGVEQRYLYCRFGKEGISRSKRNRASDAGGQMKYVIESSKSVDQATLDLQDAVKRNGFGVLHIYDLKQTLTEKGAPIEQECRILEVCNPQKAREVLEADMSMNLALPCRISVYEQDGRTKIGLISPKVLLSLLSESPGLSELADEVENAIKQMIEEAK